MVESSSHFNINFIKYLWIDKLTWADVNTSEWLVTANLNKKSLSCHDQRLSLKSLQRILKKLQEFTNTHKCDSKKVFESKKLFN